MLYGRGSLLAVTTTANQGSFQEWSSNIALGFSRTFDASIILGEPLLDELEELEV